MKTMSDSGQRIGNPHSQQEGGTQGAQTPQIWRLLDSLLNQHAGPAGSAGGSAPTLAGLGSASTLKPTDGSSAGEEESPLQSSPSQLSIEKAIAQRFASLGIQQQSVWRVRWDQFVQNEGEIFVSFCRSSAASLYFFFHLRSERWFVIF